MEYVKGFEKIREPDSLLATGHVVEIHTHNQPHITRLTMGLWDVFRLTPIVGNDGNQLMTKVEKKFEWEEDGVKKSSVDIVEELMWNRLPALRIQGGGPGAVLEVPAEVKHEMHLIEGPGFYQCAFANRDGEGNLCEVWKGYDVWTH